MPRRKKAFDGLSMTDAELLAAALFGLGRQRSEIDEKMAELRRRVDAGRPMPDSARVVSAEPAVKKRRLSAAARRRMAEAARRRWAAAKAEAAPKPGPVPKKRSISTARMKRIIAATKKRWAAFHAKKAAASKT